MLDLIQGASILIKIWFSIWVVMLTVLMAGPSSRTWLILRFVLTALAINTIAIIWSSGS